MTAPRAAKGAGMARDNCPTPSACVAGARSPCKCQRLQRSPRRFMEREARCVRLYRHGFTIRDLAEEFGVTFQRIHQILIAAGEPLRSRGYRSERDA